MEIRVRCYQNGGEVYEVEGGEVDEVKGVGVDEVKGVVAEKVCEVENREDQGNEGIGNI